MAAPTPPTELVEVEVGTDIRDGVPIAVTVASTEDSDGNPEGEDSSAGEAAPGAAPVVGPHADRIGVDTAWLAAAGMTGAAGNVHDVALPGSTPPVGWVVGVGAGTARDYRKAGAALVRAVDGRAAADHKDGRQAADAVQVALPSDVTADQVAAFALGAALGGYSFRVTGEERPPRTRSVTLLAPAEHEAAARRALVLAGATALVRDLANMPSNIKDPAWLADTASTVAATVPGLSSQVRDVEWLRANGFGGVLAVGGGSSRPPRLIELSWRPTGDASGPHLVLVGKGITFDTGGISIKPALNMHVMRTDMAGGAVVIAALVAIARLGLPIRVTGLVPAAENHVSGSAYRPGDVVRHADGRTTEVTNTDAEGRMVLADAIGYAVQTLRPDVIVDVATLTGAMRVSLGTRTGGFFATDDELADRLMAAGERAGESWWRMPLGYDVVELHTGDVEKVRSRLADVSQCPEGPGAIAAALFLREFTGGVRWVHLDIAGAARAEKAFDEVAAGATGFAARTVVELAQAYAG